MEVATFTCSICGETSRDLCVFCTKDTCRNHMCHRCHRCSDCCECEMPASSKDDETAVAATGSTNAGAPVETPTDAHLELATPVS